MASKKSGALNPAWTGQPITNQKQSFGEFLWNSQTNEFLGRSGISWLKITVFYIIFYACLTAFFLASLQIFTIINLNDDSPKYTLDSSLITNNPGLGFQPTPDRELIPESTLIWINRQAESENSPWALALNKFFEKYDTAQGSEVCSYEKPAGPGRACLVNNQQMLECNGADNFGYTSGQSHKVKPCVLVKLNRIYDWVPEPYMNEKDLTLAESNGMPADLQQRIRELIQRSEAGDKEATDELKTVWISCEGENPADKENVGPRRYFLPGTMDRDFPGIPNYYFPYLNQPNYVSPFVFVQFEALNEHVLVNVRCKAWAKNIIPNALDMKGMAHFELLID